MLSLGGWRLCLVLMWSEHRRQVSRLCWLIQLWHGPGTRCWCWWGCCGPGWYCWGMRLTGMQSTCKSAHYLQKHLVGGLLLCLHRMKSSLLSLLLCPKYPLKSSSLFSHLALFSAVYILQHPSTVSHVCTKIIIRWAWFSLSFSSLSSGKGQSPSSGALFTVTALCALSIRHICISRGVNSKISITGHIAWISPFIERNNFSVIHVIILQEEIRHNALCCLHSTVCVCVCVWCNVLMPSLR